MEKVLYVVWRGRASNVGDAEALDKRLRGEIADKLLALGARGVQVNLADAAVQPADALRQVNTRPQ